MTTRINNSAEGKRIMAWQKRLGVKADGWWGKNTAAAYNAYLAKQNPNKPDQTLQQATQSINPKPIQATPGYGIHVGDSGVTLSTPNGQTTDITNSHNVSALINNGNYKFANLGTLPTNQLDNTPLSNYQKLSEHNFNRSDIRQAMRDNGLKPYSYSGSDRKQLRTYLNDPTTDSYTQSVGKIVGDLKVQQNMLNNAVQNQTDKYQLTKPQLVNLKFKQGGQMFKYQQGGQAQQAGGQQGMEQQAIALVQAAMQGDQQATQTIQQIMQAAQQGDQQAVQVAQLLQTIIQKMQGSRKARLGAKLNYFKQASECPEGQEVVYFNKGGEICKVCQGKKMQNGGNPIEEFKKKKQTVTKHQQGGWINRNKGIWNWDSLDRMNRIQKAYQTGITDQITDDDLNYLLSNPQLESFLHNIYKTSKLPDHVTSWVVTKQKDLNNAPENAIPNEQIPSVPDSVNNFSGRIGITPFKLKPAKKSKQQSQSRSKGNNNGKGLTTTAGQSRMTSLAAGQQRLNETSVNGYGRGGSKNAFESMVVAEHGVLKGGDWRNDIKVWKDPKTGKSYYYITVDGINYLNNGRYWNPTTKRGGNYSWKPGWGIFGGGFHRN